jgi:hypothetical protein
MRQNRLEIAKMVSNPEEFNIAVSQAQGKVGRADAFATHFEGTRGIAEYARKAG